MLSMYAHNVDMLNKEPQTYSDSEVLMALRKATEGLSIRKAAAHFGVSGAYIHDVLKGRRGISEKIASQLGFELVPPSEHKWVRIMRKIQ